MSACLSDFFIYEIAANEQTYRLVVSDYRRPGTLATPETPQVRNRPLGNGGG